MATQKIKVNFIDSDGSANGQILTSNGSAVVWSNPTDTANNANNLGGVAAANYVQNTDSRTLSGNLTFTGENTVFSGTKVSVTGQLNTADVTITGNLIVSGTTTTVNTTTLDVTDKNITLAKGSASGAVANGAGFTIDGANATFVYDDVANTFVSSLSLQVNGGATINSTAFSGTANNALYLGGNSASDLQTYADNKAANAYSNATSYVDNKSYVNTSQLSTNLANYQTTAGLAANVATLTANNANNLNGVAAASYVQNTDTRTLSGNLTFTGLSTFTGNIVINSVSANGGYGTAGQVLTSNGSTTYWSTVASGSVNVSAQYVWTNTHTFYANLTANSIVANGSVGTNGQVLTSNGTSVYWSIVKPRISSTASVTSPLTINTDNFDQYSITAQAEALTFNADSGSPSGGQKLVIRIKDDGTARALTWTTGVSKGFRAIGATLPTTTTISKTLYIGAIYNSDDSRWDVVATALEA